jgi:hypothetical protein
LYHLIFSSWEAIGAASAGLPATESTAPALFRAARSIPAALSEGLKRQGKSFIHAGYAFVVDLIGPNGGPGRVAATFGPGTGRVHTTRRHEARRKNRRSLLVTAKTAAPASRRFSLPALFRALHIAPRADCLQHQHSVRIRTRTSYRLYL